MSNPWDVGTVQAFHFFCCPECIYRHHEESAFQSHAIESHPQSKILFDIKEEFKNTDIEIHATKDDESEDLPLAFTLLPKPKRNIDIHEKDDEKDEKFKSEDDNKDFDLIETEDLDKDDFDLDWDEKEDNFEKEGKGHGQICTFCGKFIERRKFSYHQKCQHGCFEVEKHGIKLFKCSKCSFKSGDSSEVISHVKENHMPYENGALYECSKCTDTFHDLIDLGIHLNNEHDRQVGVYQCPACPTTCPCNTKLKVHIESAHLSKKVNCPECSKAISLHSLRSHLKVHRDRETNKLEKPFKCDECDYSTHAKRYLQAHFSKCHKKDNYQYLCDECDKRFEFPSQLSNHKESKHEGLRPLVCEKCGKGFPKVAKSTFEQHVKGCGALKDKTRKVWYKKADEVFQCSICDKNFPIECHYINHYKEAHDCLPPSYEDKDLISCDKCPKVFSNKQSLASHKYNAHSTTPLVKKSFPCPQCEKVFGKPWVLKDHIKTRHENNTPFKCDQCHRSYGTKSRLTTHKFNTHRQVKCEECGQQICSAFMLRRHKATVHGIKPTNVHQCQHCPLFYTLKSQLLKHMNKQHPFEQVSNT